MSIVQDLISKLLTKKIRSPAEEFDRRVALSQAAKDRQVLRQEWNVSGLPPDQRARARRAIETIVRRRLKAERRAGNPIAESSLEERVLLLRDKRSSLLLDSVYPERNRPGNWKKLDKRRLDYVERIELKNFSFIDDPIKTVKSLRQIAKAEAELASVRLDFCDEYCFDVAPFMLLAESWPNILPVFSGGRMEIPMQKVLSAVGIPQAMGIGVEGVTDYQNVLALPLRRRRRIGSTGSLTRELDAQTSEMAVDAFCDTLDKWLGAVGVGLNDGGKGWTKLIIGELLENAERHSDGQRKDGSWAISGFMVRRKDPATDEWQFKVQIGIVNPGNTFSDSLKRAQPEICEKLDRYVHQMTKLGAPQSRDTLRTLVAIQDTITCDPVADADERGGFGLQEMLDLICMLGQSKLETLQPKVTIISGNSCIQLRAPYIRGSNNGIDGNPRVQWFNPDNDQAVQPDSRFVFDLPQSLPGTAISIRFALDRNFYDQLRSGEERNDNDRPRHTNRGEGPQPDRT